jgi:hypothetical protein
VLLSSPDDFLLPVFSLCPILVPGHEKACSDLVEFTSTSPVNMPSRSVTDDDTGLKVLVNGTGAENAVEYANLYLHIENTC